MTEKISTEALECGEGPMWDGESLRLYWTDAMGDTIYAYDHAAEKTSKVIEGRQAGAIALRADGGLVLGTGEGFYTWNEKDGVKVAANECDGRAIEHINDIIADPGGRVFGGQECYQEDEDYERGFLYRLDPDGSVRIVEEGLGLSNGMGFSPDKSTFYLTDSVERSIYAYDYDEASGAIKDRRILITLGQNEGLPDGMTVDSEGFVWTARWFGAGISRFDPEGKFERKIDLPVAQTSSLMFGGPDLNEIYITSAGVMWESKLAPQGHDYSFPRGGDTFRIVQDIQGKAEFRAKI